MKTVSKILMVAFATIFLRSCLTGEYHSTPRMFIASLYRTTPAGVCDTLSRLDTIQVGDTMRAVMVLDGVYNTLVAFQVSADRTAFDYRLECDSVAGRLLAEGSQPEKGSLYFAKDCYQFFTTLYYVPLQAGKYDFTFTLSSTAGEKYSPVTGTLTQVVR